MIWVYIFSYNIKSNKSHNGQGWGRCTKNKRQWVVGNRWMIASKLLCVEILFKIRLENPVIQRKPAHHHLPTIWLLFKQIRMLTNVVQPHWLMVVIIYYTSYSHAHQPHHILYYIPLISRCKHMEFNLTFKMINASIFLSITFLCR